MVGINWLENMKIPLLKFSPEELEKQLFIAIFLLSKIVEKATLFESALMPAKFTFRTTEDKEYIVRSFKFVLKSCG